jgi:type II secretory pathway pseudopilin PulG
MGKIKKRAGFTLIEVIVAMGIFMIVVVALIVGYVTYYRYVTGLRIETVGQNLARLQLEDIENLPIGTLSNLVKGGEFPPNYPIDTDSNNAFYYSDEIDGSFEFSPIDKLLNDVDGSIPPELDKTKPEECVLPTTIDIVKNYESGIFKNYSIIIHKETYPHFTKEIKIEDLTPSQNNLLLKIFKIEVTIIWNWGGIRKSYTVTGERSFERT